MNKNLQIDSTDNVPAESSPRIIEAKRILRVMFARWAVIFGIIIIVIFLFLAAFGPLIAPHNPNKVNLSNALQHPSREYLLGTDTLGRDILSRIIYGTRISLMVGVVAITISGIVGMGLGLIAGYFGKWTNNIIMRLMDAVMSIPPMALALAIAAFLGGGLLNIMLAIGAAMVPTFCRLMCGQVLTLKESDFIKSALIAGATDTRIMLRHLFPNAFPSLMVLISLNMGIAILMEASLSFLGIGILPPAIAWGRMVNEGYRHLISNPILSFAPGTAVLLVVLAFNMVGDGLRDALDPRLRGTL